MKRLFFVICLCISHESSAQEYLSIGESLTLKTPVSSKIYVQRKGLLQIKDLGSKIKIIGKKLGHTKINIGSAQYEIYIIKKNLFQNLKSLEEWAKNKRGPIVKYFNNELIISGKILRLNDFIDLNQYLNKTSKVTLSAKIDENIKESLQLYLNQLIESNNLEKGQIIWEPELSLHLDNKSKKYKTQYTHLLSPYGIKVKFDSLQVAQKPLIKIKLYVAHIKKSFLRNWGIQWPGEFSAQIIPHQSPRIQNFNLSLKTLETNGNGKTLASPSLITESGNTAEFHSGGEFPIQTSTQFSNSVEWKRYGLSFKTTPLTNSHGHLQIDIRIDVSTLDQTQSQNGIPALNRSYLTTKINMKKAKPFFLSGFLQHMNQNGKQGLPWLSQIPLFSSLFSNKQIFNNDYELIFILVPEIHES